MDFGLRASVWRFAVRTKFRLLVAYSHVPCVQVDEAYWNEHDAGTDVSDKPQTNLPKQASLHAVIPEFFEALNC